MQTQRNAAPKIRVGAYREIDWTPPAARVHPRVVTVERPKLVVGVQETETGFLVLAGDRNPKAERWNLFNTECTPAELDDLIDSLTIARDKAKSLGMPRRARC